MALFKLVLFGLLASTLSLSLPQRGSKESVESLPKKMNSKVISTTLRLTRLRALMAANSDLKAYIIPTGDAHQSEYVSKFDDRKGFISGFTGSSGSVIVTPDEALLWTDGRYYLQAESQLDENWQLMRESLPTTPTRERWLLNNLPPNSNVAANPLLLSNSEWEPLQTELHKAGHTFIPLNEDLVEQVWEEDESLRPDMPANSIYALPIQFSGKSIADKLVDIRAKMTERNANVLIITGLDEIAHLFNLRGSDIPYNPVFYGYGIVTQDPDKIHLISRSALFGDTVEAHFQSEGIADQLEIEPYETALDVIQSVIASFSTKNDDVGVWVAPGSSRAVYLAATTGPTKVNLIAEITPVALMKAIKNDVEAQGMINCHIRDGAALAKYFSWLEEEIIVNRNNITEISGATELERIRGELPNFVGLSFSTISGSGPNGAIIHYKPEPETDRPLTTEELYLCDSGAQYWDGTTDVTRTMHFGTPSEVERESFTLVLKGQVALGISVFPYRIKGNVLDTLARRYLWQQGMNYAHGTGHGIGHFLNVHEGPMGISWRQMPDDPGLEANMFLSNEPGYYENGQYGIRLEDIVRVVTLIPPGDMSKASPKPRNLKDNFAGQGACGFETITMSPIQRKMIILDMLTEEEIQYIDNYHATVYEKVLPVLDQQGWESAKTWLAENTRPLRE